MHPVHDTPSSAERGLGVGQEATGQTLSQRPSDYRVGGKSAPLAGLT